MSSCPVTRTSAERLVRFLVNFYKNVVVYRNNANDKNGIRVKPVGVKSNLDVIGARISLFAAGNGKKMLLGTRHVQSAAGYGRSSPSEAHFGRGKKPAANYRVEFYFPAAKTLVVKEDVEPVPRIVISESDQRATATPM